MILSACSALRILHSTGSDHRIACMVSSPHEADLMSRYTGVEVGSETDVTTEPPGYYEPIRAQENTYGAVCACILKNISIRARTPFYLRRVDVQYKRTGIVIQARNLVEH